MTNEEKELAIQYYERVLEGMASAGFSIFIDELRSKIRDCEIGLTSEVLMPLDENNEIKDDVKSRIVKEHIKKQAFIELLEFFDEEYVKGEISKLRMQDQEPVEDQEPDDEYQ